MAKHELVLELSIEGGGMSIYRTRQPPAAGSSTSGEARSTSTKTIPKFGDRGRRSPSRALTRLFGPSPRHGSWVIFFPRNVHPEYRAMLWQLAQNAAETLTEQQKKHWNRRVHDWRGECRQDFNHETD